MLRGPAAPHLMIGGRGPLKEALKRQAEDRGVAERVTFLDYIPDECIPAYYAAADVFVLPSVVDERDDTEGLGVVLLEALACETPCVASNVGGIPDIIKDKHNGFLVEPGNPKALADRISRLVSDPELRQHMGRQGRLDVKKRFSWALQAEDMLAVYRKVS
jgi:glycosyltransferase involved in cell wall biosynthesis